MVFRKRTEIEKRINRLKREIEQLNNSIESDFNKADEYSKKGEEGKALQCKTRAGISIDKRRVINRISIILINRYAI